MKFAKILAMLIISASLLTACTQGTEKAPADTTPVVTEPATEPNVVSGSEDAITIAKRYVREKYENKYINHSIETVQEDDHWYVYFDPTEENGESLEVTILKKTGEIISCIENY